MQKLITAVSLASLVLLLGTGCSDSNNPAPPGSVPTPAVSPTPTATPSPTAAPVPGFTQVDRTALPAVATLFIDPLNPSRSQSPSDPRNSFNSGTPTDAAQFEDIIRTNLRVLRGVDDNPANDEGGPEDVTDPTVPRVSIATALALTAPDVMRLDLDGTVPGLLFVELGIPNAFGGRTLAEDVADAGLNVIVFPGAGPAFNSDYADANAVPFQAQFPYVGLPNPGP